jgi:2Fe-2S ferredoxin
MGVAHLYMISYNKNTCLFVIFAIPMAQITFLFEEKGKEPLQVEIFEGESILDVALDNNIHLNHNCGGVCGCSTCHIYVEKGEDLLPEMSDREEEYVDRARYPKYNSRLACQCNLETNGELTVVIPDQSGIIGH